MGSALSNRHLLTAANPNIATPNRPLPWQTRDSMSQMMTERESLDGYVDAEAYFVKAPKVLCLGLLLAIPASSQ